jgi:hypothetical protein
MASQQASGGLRSPVAVDRLLLAACAVIWLAVIAMGVVATVALVDMGGGRHRHIGSGSHTPWVLYAVIAVSAVIILGAIPLLLRARRSASGEPRRAQATAGQRQGVGAGEPYGPARIDAGRTEKLRVSRPVAESGGRDPHPYRPPRQLRFAGPSPEAVDRVWLRVTVAMIGAMGLAVLAVAAATYLMAVNEDDYARITLGVAGVVTALMPVIPWRYLSQLRETIAAGG